MSFRTTIAAALTACLLLVGRAADAEPALWAAHGPNSTVYLFGTIHVLRSDTVWRSPKIAAAFAKAMGIPTGVAAFEPMRPWLVAVALSVGPMLKAGFETASQQLHYFADLPEALQVAYLRHVLDDSPKAASTLNGLYDTLILKRNVAWADRLAARLQQPGISRYSRMN